MFASEMRMDCETAWMAVWVEWGLFETSGREGEARIFCSVLNSEVDLVGLSCSVWGYFSSSSIKVCVLLTLNSKIVLSFSADVSSTLSRKWSLP